MAAGSFRKPRKDKRPSGSTRFGRRRDANARGGISQNVGAVSGWEHAVNVWVDVRAFIWSYDGNTYDITDDIITGSLQRNTDAPTTMSITFANEGDKYRQIFIPNDRIVLFLRRNETEWQSFTGYIHNTPMFNLYSSREITLNCSCIIRRLSQKFWDPNLMENIFILASPDPSIQKGEIGGTAPPTEEPAEGETPSTTEPETAGAEEDAAEDDTLTAAEQMQKDNEEAGIVSGGTEPTTPDMTLAFLLTAPDHIGLKPEMVLIQQFPETWAARAAQITRANAVCMSQWADLIVCPDPSQDCSEGGTGGESVTGAPCEDGQTIGQVVDEAGFTGEAREQAIQTACCESTLRAGVPSDDPNDPNVQAGLKTWGLFQILPSTCQGVDPDCTEEKLRNPVYNAQIAKKIYEQNGNSWLNQWGCQPGSPGYGDCSEDDPITGCEETAGAKVRNMELTEFEIAGSGFCDDSAWNYNGSGGNPTFGWTSLMQGLVDDVKSKWDVFANTYVGHPGGEENSADFWDDSSMLSLDSGVGGEIYDYLKQTYGDQINWIIWEGEMTDPSGIGPDTSGWGHYDHVHVTAGSDDCGGGTLGGGGGGAFGPGGVPCGSGRGGTTTTPTEDEKSTKTPPQEEGETGSPETAGSRMLAQDRLVARDNLLLKTLVHEGKQMLETPFRWGGGHGFDIEIGDLKRRGVDASGLFNHLRTVLGLSPGDVGSTAEYFNFLDDVRKFDSRKAYPVGTILINPGNWNTMGHMGMVIDNRGKVLEASAVGRVVTRYTIRESSLGWAGYTHVGVMPDVTSKEITFIASAVRKEKENKMHMEFMRELQEIHNNPNVNSDELIGYCGTEPRIGAEEILGWDLVGWDRKIYYTINSKYADHFKNAANKWNSTGAVEILPARSGDRVDVEVFDDKLNNRFAETRSNGFIVFDPEAMDQGTENLQEAVAVHELGHALGLNHTQDSSKPSVMMDPFIKGSNSNIDIPTEYDTQEYRNLWGDEMISSIDEKGGVTGATETPTDGTQTDEGGEPCITRHPLGVYKLASNAMREVTGSNTLLAESKKTLALTDGSSVEVKNHLAEIPDIEQDAYQNFPELWAETQEEREWRHIAELDKQSYMSTVQDIADAGLYTMMSIGTGEIVFWYPWIVKDLADNVAVPEGRSHENLGEGEGSPKGPKNKPNLGKGKKKDKTAGATEDEETTEPSDVRKQLDNPTDISGVPLSGTNASVLDQKVLLKDIDLIDFSLFISDDALVTHYFVLGEYRLLGGTLGGILDLPCWRWSTIFDNPMIVAQAKNTAHFDPTAFIQRYGVRSKSEHVKALKIPGMAQIWAEQQWLKHWLECYLIQLQTTFLPEVYPGTRIEIESLGVEVVVLQAVHSFGATWSTKLTVSMPLAVTNDTLIPPLPFWTLFTTEMPDTSVDLTDLYDPGASLGGGDIWESVTGKKDADNERVRKYLDGWLDLKERGMLNLIPDFVQGKLPGQQETDDSSGEVLSADRIRALQQRHPELKNVAGLDKMTAAELKKQFPHINI